MNTPRIEEIKIDPLRLPPIELGIEADTPEFIAEAIGALARNDGAACLNAVGRQSLATRNEFPSLFLLCLGHYAAGNIRDCETLADRLNASGEDVLMCIVQAACAERQHNVDGAVAALIAAFRLMLGLPRDAATDVGAILRAGFLNLTETVGAGLGHTLLNTIGGGLDRLGVFVKYADDIVPHLPALADAVVTKRDFAFKNVHDVVAFVCFESTANEAWQDKVFSHFIVPMLAAVLHSQRQNAALHLELQYYTSYIKARETADQFRQAYRQLAPVLSAAGSAFGAALSSFAPLTRKGRYRVAFVAPNIGYLAHVVAALDIIECIKQLPDNRLDCELLGLTGPDEQTARRCAAMELPLRTFCDPYDFTGDYVSGFKKMRQHLQENGFDAVVWVSVAPSCAFALGMRLAPMQIFFSMKYHSFSVPQIDAYLSGGPAGQDFKMIEGRRWRIGQTKYSGLFDPGASRLAAKLKAKVGPDRIVLGCLGREEKINSAEFLDTVVAILRRHPHAIFMWTGRKQLPAIQEHFERAGVAAQCQYIGWVKTQVYAQVFDIFLDSFPFPCAVTALQSMAAGMPIVLYDSPEARETGVAVFIQPLLDGEAGTPEQRAQLENIFQLRTSRPLLLMSRTQDEYLRFADALIEDQDFRKAVGEASRLFTAQFVTDERACGQTYERHIFEAIDEQAAAG